MADREQQRTCRAKRWLAFLFLLAAAVSAGWVLGSHSWFPTWHGFPNTASTTALLLAASAFAVVSVSLRYKRGIVAGLGFSVLGDFFLMLPSDQFVPGLASFLGTQLCYLWAVLGDHRRAASKAPFLLFLLWGVLLVTLLWPGLPAALCAPVLLYAATLLALASQATSRALEKRDLGSLLVAIGAALFVFSDSLLAFQRFRHPVEWGRTIVLGTYFAAQFGFALSVVFFKVHSQQRTLDPSEPLQFQRRGDR